MTESNRERDVRQQVNAVALELEDADEVKFAIGILRERGRELGRHSVLAYETLSRQFLQGRYQLWGPEYRGPWPMEVERPLKVWHKKSGIDLVKGATYTKKWDCEISKAHFCALGQKNLGRYVELQVAVEQVIKDPAERTEYGYGHQEKIAVYCTLRSLITARPHWVLGNIQRVRVARARAIARRTIEESRS